MKVEELEALRKKAVLIALIGFPLTAILFLVLAAADMPVLAFAVLVAGGVTAGILFYKARRSFSLAYKEAFVKTALEDTFDDLTYDPDGGLPRDVIADTGFMDMGDHYTATDYIKGSYKSIPVELSSILIQEEHTDTDSKGNTTTSLETLFQGQWMIFKFNKNFTSTVQVRQKFFANTISNLFTKKGKKVEMEDTEFNKLFNVFSGSQQEAFYILTPQIMAKMKEIAKANSGSEMMYGFKDNLLHIAVSSSEDSFSPKLFKKIDEEKAKKAISSGISLITDFVDYLQLDNDLFLTKE